MQAMRRSLQVIVPLVVVATHALLLPVLAISLDQLFRRSEVDLFTSFVEDFSQRRALWLTHESVDTSDPGLQNFLDSTMTEGAIVFAELIRDGRSIRATQVRSDVQWPVSGPDAAYGYGVDHAFFVSKDLTLRGRPATLRLGFDETATDHQISHVRHLLLLSIAGYLLLICLLAIWLSRKLSHPLVELRDKARHIASGDFAHQLATTSRILEVTEMSAHLESMRREFVAVNDRLQRQLEAGVALEGQLRVKHRLEAVGTLAGGLAHEINNVLVPITLYTETALDDVAADHPARSSLERVLKACQRARNIIEKVLAFGRQVDVAPLRPIDLATAVEEGLRLFDALRPAPVQLRTYIDEHCPLAIADPTMIVQVVINLCSNALHAMPPLGGFIEVGLRPARTDEVQRAGLGRGDFVCLTVRDSGSGMDTTTRERIFDPFFTTRQVGQGSGLGLSVIHGIVATLGGAIIVDSEVAQGSTFTVLFPAAKAAEPAT